MSAQDRLWALPRSALLGLLSGILAYASCTQAHESRPAYLELKEIVPGRYDVLWRTPLWSGMRLPLALKFSDGVRDITKPALQELPDSLVERRLIEADGGLAGKRITIDGLSATITDVFVRIVRCRHFNADLSPDAGGAFARNRGNAGSISGSSDLYTIGSRSYLGGRRPSLVRARADAHCSRPLDAA